MNYRSKKESRQNIEILFKERRLVLKNTSLDMLDHILGQFILITLRDEVQGIHIRPKHHRAVLRVGKVVEAVFVCWGCLGGGAVILVGIFMVVAISIMRMTIGMTIAGTVVMAIGVFTLTLTCNAFDTLFHAGNLGLDHTPSNPLRGVDDTPESSLGHEELHFGLVRILRCLFGLCLVLRGGVGVVKREGGGCWRCFVAVCAGAEGRGAGLTVDGRAVAYVCGDELSLLFGAWVAVDVEVPGDFGDEVIVAPFRLMAV